MRQTQELRTVLDDRLEDEQPEYKTSFGFGHSLVGSESSESVSNSPQSVKGLSISAHIRRNLCEIYLRNVDPVFKVLHRPSLRAFLCDEKPYLDYELDHHTPATLALAVYYAAVCTIDDSHVQSLFGSDKTTITAELQRETEIALVKADFVTTNDLTVLQAYVISLVGFSLLPPYAPQFGSNLGLIIRSSRPVAKIKVGVYGRCCLWLFE